MPSKPFHQEGERVSFWFGVLAKLPVIPVLGVLLSKMLPLSEPCLPFLRFLGQVPSRAAQRSTPATGAAPGLLQMLHNHGRLH